MGLFSKKKKEETPDLDKVIKNGDGTITFFDKFGNSHTVDDTIDKDEYLKGIYNYLDTPEESDEVSEEDK